MIVDCATAPKLSVSFDMRDILMLGVRGGWLFAAPFRPAFVYGRIMPLALRAVNW